ncbi:MAG: transposase [Chloroflexi bacterium]|nr:MAG: transposase [Chloroflexota bacterium]
MEASAMELLAPGQVRVTGGGKQLILYLSAKWFGRETWAQLSAGFKTEDKDDWRTAPFRVMTREEDVPGYPRWKQNVLDGLSWLIFHLLVPADHKLVKLWHTVDWTVINRVCAGAYNNSKFGQRAWAPAQLFALLLLFFVLPMSSECQLTRTVAIVPLYRWFCGFGLFSPLPDHSALYDFRKKMKPERFEAILTWVVWRCQEARLISNELLYFDMTGVAASSRHWSPYERVVLLTMALIRYWDRRLGHNPSDSLSPDELHQLMAEVAIEVLENKSLRKNPKAPGSILHSVQRWNERQQQARGQVLWDLNLEEVVAVLLAQEEGEEEPLASQQPTTLQSRLKSIAKDAKRLLLHAAGDRDARMGWVSNVRLLCGYWLGFLVDSRFGVITAVSTVPLTTVQSTQMTAALEVHRARIGAYPDAVAADSAQDYHAVHMALDTREIKGHISSRAYSSSGDGLQLDNFAWDKGQLHCPMRHVLTPGAVHSTGHRFYEAQAADCQQCPLREMCLPKKQRPEGPRRIYLDAAAHQRWQQNREHTRTDQYKEAQAKRFASEGHFGLAKRLYGADKMPYRSAAMNEIAGVLITTCMDLVILARHG